MDDDVMDAHVDWREGCARVSEGYERWWGAVQADTALALRTYLAVRDRGERASDVYPELISRLERAVLSCSPKPIEDGGSQQW
jgi:hypothetical protein